MVLVFLEGPWKIHYIDHGKFTPPLKISWLLENKYMKPMANSYNLTSFFKCQNLLTFYHVPITKSPKVAMLVWTTKFPKFVCILFLL